MIRPPGFAGVAFGTVDTGDLRKDRGRRELISADLGISADWAFANQVHGAEVLVANRSGKLGDADAIISTNPAVPCAVATADCVPVSLHAAAAVAVVHAGWRGAAAGVLEATISTMTKMGQRPVTATIGPSIGPCCYEVGEEVAARFGGHVSETTWGSTSIDIPGYLEAKLRGMELWKSDICTFSSDQMHSWRRDHTKQRQVTVAWLPNA